MFVEQIQRLATSPDNNNGERKQKIEAARSRDEKVGKLDGMQEGSRARETTGTAADSSRCTDTKRLEASVDYPWRMAAMTAEQSRGRSALANDSLYSKLPEPSHRQITKSKHQTDLDAASAELEAALNTADQLKTSRMSNEYETSRRLLGLKKIFQELRRQ